MSYLIRATFHRYVGTISSTPRVNYYGRHFADHGFDNAAPLVPFETAEEARAAVRESENQNYYLGNGETSRPTLVVVPISRAPAYIREII